MRGRSFPIRKPSKYTGAILQIAGPLNVAEEDEQVFGIPGEIMRKAIKIGKDFLTHSAYAYSMMGSDLTIKKVKFVLSNLTTTTLSEYLGIRKQSLFF